MPTKKYSELHPNYQAPLQTSRFVDMTGGTPNTYSNIIGDSPATKPTVQIKYRTPGIHGTGIPVPLTKMGQMDKRTREYREFKIEENRRKVFYDSAREKERVSAAWKGYNKQKGYERGAAKRKIGRINKLAALKRARKMKWGFGLAALAGSGALVAASPVATRLLAGPRNRLMTPGGGAMDEESVRQAGFWERQASVAIAGRTTGRGAGAALIDYNIGRINDIRKFTFDSPLSGGGLTPGAAVGATLGGGLSLLGASTLTMFAGKGKMKGGKAAGLSLGIGAIGALTGGYQGAKVDLAISRSIQTARKNILGAGRAGRLSNKTRISGRGYRMWASPRGTPRKGQPGHLGMDGSMPFAMHNARRRSTL
tara:strand:+ start:659 stop:1759 length:1101 start_codon:yes stop_codon:yes gene_type:complete